MRALGIVENIAGDEINFTAIGEYFKRCVAKYLMHILGN